MRILLLLFLLVLCSCASRAQQGPENLTSVQIIDRNGFSETISVKSRLETFDKVNFLAPQPYKKVMRVFGKNATGQALAKITSYHSNGQLWQYLEVVNGRAFGPYREWHPNGRLKLEGFVIEGIADVAQRSQSSWVFDGKSSAYDEEGQLVAEIFYEKGALEGNSLYYHSNGKLARSVPYHHDLLEGTLEFYDEMGRVTETIPYHLGLRQGSAVGYWSGGAIKYYEEYQDDLLKTGTYFFQDSTLAAEIKEGEGQKALFKDNTISSLIEYQGGVICGKVQLFDQEGRLTGCYHIRDNKKQGEEWEYYPKEKLPKLYLYWDDDKIQGMAKTWYPNGVQQSEREMHGNKKHGLSFAWYEEGQIMLIEEYENDTLVKGSYFKKGDKLPVSKIENGKGIATLYDSRGHFIKKIPYDRNQPTLE
jgi:antitoxin component YwqK of YwqJK toxin-antitoxin module